MRCFYGWHGMHGGFFGNPLMMLIFAALLGGIIWLILAKKPAVVSNQHGEKQALDILQKRYARGEIDENTYFDMKDKLNK